MNSYQNKNKISIKSLCKNYDDIEILKDIEINVGEGEFVSILGPSGCGKSTIFNVIAGLTDFSCGSLEIDGKLSYMYQKDLLLPYKTIIDNVSLPMVLNKTKRSEAHKIVKPYFEIFGLSGYENKYPRELSGGMKQRANFLRTYMNSSEVMLLDEPFGALDSITKNSMQKWLFDVKDKMKSTILLVTHDIDEAIMLSDRIYVLSQKPAYVKRELKVDRKTYNENTFEYSSKLKKEILDLL